jgi:hypothetical protein
MIEPVLDYKENQLIHPKLIAIDAMNVIVRGEISAVEAYKQVIKKLFKDPEHKRLLELLSWHEGILSYWKIQVDLTKMPHEESSGFWGLIVEAFVGTAKLLGNSTALLSLKKGEEHGLKEYQNFLDNEYVSEENKKFVKDKIIPELKRHIQNIDSMAKLH